MTIDEINTILRECMAEVLTWPAWKRSDDVIREFPEFYADEHQHRSGEGKPPLVRDMIHRKKRRSPHG